MDNLCSQEGKITDLQKLRSFNTSSKANTVLQISLSGLDFDKQEAQTYLLFTNRQWRLTQVNTISSTNFGTYISLLIALYLF